MVVRYKYILILNIIILIILLSFIDNVHAFKSDVDASCKFFSKVRGKRQDAVVVSEMFASLLEAEFPEIFGNENPESAAAVDNSSSSKKRGRTSMDGVEIEGTPERQSKKKAARQEKEEVEEVATLSSAEKVKSRKDCISLYMYCIIQYRHCTILYVVRAVLIYKAYIVFVCIHNYTNTITIYILIHHTLYRTHYTIRTDSAEGHTGQVD